MLAQQLQDVSGSSEPFRELDQILTAFHKLFNRKANRRPSGSSLQRRMA
jgi:hypothetical protein